MQILVLDEAPLDLPGVVRGDATMLEPRAIAAHAARIVRAPPPSDGPLTFDELQLAGRNRGMPLEGLRYDITPIGMHYLLVHFDIPAIDPATNAFSLFSS